MVDRLSPHRHCEECGKAVGPKEKFCSEDCRETNGERIKGKKRQLMYLYIGGIVLFALAMLSFLGGG